MTFNRLPICSTVKVIPTTLWPPTVALWIALLYGASDPVTVTVRTTSITRQ